MSLAANQFLFSGAAAMTSQGAAGFILSSNQYTQLSANLQVVHDHLSTHGLAQENLTEFSRALSSFNEALDQDDNSEQLEASKTELARIVAEVPDRVWRVGNAAFLAPRDQHLTYLANILGELSTVSGSRLYATTAGDDDKAYLRTIMGGLNIFINHSDAKSNSQIVGMVTEVSLQIKDEAIQSLAQGLKMTFSNSPTRSLSAGGPRPAAAEGPVVTPQVTIQPPAIEQLPFEYHANSNEPHDKEGDIQKLYIKLQNADIAWPYDFVRWMRSLYLYAAELPNGSSSGVLRNLTQGLTRLDQLPTLSLRDIRTILGPATIKMGRPLNGLPDDWPRDLPNDMGSDLVTLWDAGLDQDPRRPIRTLVDQITEIWQLSATHESRQSVRSGLKNRSRRLQRSLTRESTIDFERHSAELAAILRTLGGDSDTVPAVDSAVEIATALQPDQGQADEIPLPDPLEAMPQEEWISYAFDFLTHERESWGRANDDSVIAQRLDHVTDMLRQADFASERSLDLLSLLFQMTLHYRQTLGVSGEAALFRNQDTTTPLGIEDMARAYEEIDASHARGDLLREWAEECSKDSNSFSLFLGEEGLSDLLDQYLELAERDEFDPLDRASRAFAHANPQHHLSPAMVRRLLAYFLGVRDGEFQDTLYRELIEALPAAEAPIVEVDQEDLGEQLFKDIDPDRFTEFAMIFIKVAAIHRPMVGGGHTKIFMFFVDRLWRIYKVYCNMMQERGSATFRSAWDEASKKSSHLHNQKLRAQYRGLFETLLSFLTEHRDLATHVHVSFLAKKSPAIYKKGARLRSAGGPTPARPDKDVTSAPVSDQVAEATEKIAETTATEQIASDENPAVPAIDEAAARSREAVYTETTVVSPDANVSNGNPFADVGTFNAVVGTATSAAPKAEMSEIADTAATSAAVSIDDAQLATISDPEPPTLPDALAAHIRSWRLKPVHEAALQDMLEHANEEQVIAILGNFSRHGHEIAKGRIWLERYSELLRLKRLTSRSKDQLLEYLSDHEIFRRIATLVMAAAVKPTELTLDRILPEPIQLGRKYGRHVSFERDAQDNSLIVVRPAVTVEEGEYSEKAVMRSGASVQVWHQSGRRRDRGRGRNRSRGRSNRIVDIGIENGEGVGEKRLLEMILKSEGAVQSTERTMLTLMVVASDMTKRARHFFFEHHPRGRLIVWRGNSFSIYRATTVDRNSDIIETETRYQPNGKIMRSATTNTLQPGRHRIPIKTIGATDWNQATQQTIIEQAARGIKRLKDLDQAHIIPSLEAARDAAIYTVGFLAPGHNDVRAVFHVLEKFSPPQLPARRIRATIEELNWLVMEIAERCAPLPDEAPQPTDVPALEQLEKASPPAEKEKKAEAQVWNRQMANFLNSMIATVNLRQVRNQRAFLARGRSNIWWRHMPEIRKRILEHLRKRPHRRDAEIRAELAHFNRNVNGTLSHESLMYLVRIAAIITNSDRRAETASTEKSTRRSLGSRNPWTGRMRKTLSMLMPNDAGISLKKCQNIATFIDHARKRLRVVHQEQIISDLKQLAKDRPRHAVALQAEIDALLRGRQETISANTALHLVQVAMILTDTQPSGAAIVTPGTTEPASTPDASIREPEASVYTAEEIEAIISSLNSDLAAIMTELDGMPDPDGLEITPLEATIARLAELVPRIEGIASRYENELADNESFYALFDKLPQPIVDICQDLEDSAATARDDAEFRLLEYRDALERAQQTYAQSQRESETVLEVTKGSQKIDSKLNEVEAKVEALIEFLTQGSQPASAKDLNQTHGAATRQRLAAQQKLAEIEAALKILRKTVADNPGLVSTSPNEAIQAVMVAYDALLSKETSIKAALAATEPLFEALQNREPTLPWSPPTSLPSAPDIISRRYQISADTPAEIVDILVQVPADQYATVNGYPELALLAPDEKVYAAEFGMIQALRTYGPNGEYIEYERNGERHYGYLASSLIRFSSKLEIKTANGESATIVKEEIISRVPLKDKNANRLEASLTDPNRYYIYKIAYFLRSLGQSSLSADSYSESFACAHKHPAEHENSYASNRLVLMMGMFAKPKLLTKLVRELKRTSEANQVTARFRRGLKNEGHVKTIWNTLKALYQAFGFNNDELDLLGYSLFYPLIWQKNKDRTQHQMDQEMQGAAIEATAPEHSSDGWVQSFADAWQKSANNSERTRWNHIVASLTIFSAADQSHLFGGRSAHSLQAYFEEGRSEDFRDKELVNGHTVHLGRQKWGLRWTPAHEGPSDMWYTALARRLARLGEQNSPILHVLNRIFRDNPNKALIQMKQEAIGIVMQDIGNDEVTRDVLEKRLLSWVFSKREQWSSISALSEISNQINAIVDNLSAPGQRFQRGRSTDTRSALTVESLQRNADIQALVPAITGLLPAGQVVSMEIFILPVSPGT